jgi:hypothetical protein
MKLNIKIVLVGVPLAVAGSIAGLMLASGSGHPRFVDPGTLLTSDFGCTLQPAGDGVQPEVTLKIPAGEWTDFPVVAVSFMYQSVPVETENADENGNGVIEGGRTYTFTGPTWSPGTSPAAGFELVGLTCQVP